jgi:hypothetical protein
VADSLRGSDKQKFPDNFCLTSTTPSAIEQQQALQDLPKEIFLFKISTTSFELQIKEQLSRWQKIRYDSDLLIQRR